MKRALYAAAALAVAVSCSDAGESPSGAHDSGIPDSALPDGAADAASDSELDAAPMGREIKVMVVNMFVLEAQGFVSGLGLTESVPVVGLSKTAPALHCNADDVCQITTAMGYANAAASMTALLYKSGFDLRHTYFIIAGVGGVDPAYGTIGSAAWARYAVDYGFSHEIDAREMPNGWPYGYLGMGANAPDQAPPKLHDSAVFQLDEDLLQAAYTLSKDLALDDTTTAAAFRALYPSAPANEPPRVIQCDVTSADTWVAGRVLNQRALDFTKLLTGGKGEPCMGAQEDNSTLEVLRRGKTAGRVDLARVALLRAGSDFGSPYPGQTDADSFLGSLQQGGYTSSTANLFKAASPLIQAIVRDWAKWRVGVPK